MSMFDHAIVNGEPVSYHVVDRIAERAKAIERYRAGTHPAVALGMPEPPELSQADCYPKNDRYQFQEFAGFVFEMGGYGDMTITDPYTLQRLWVADVWPEEETEGSIWVAMRRVIDVAEALGFPHRTQSTEEDQ